MTGIGASQKEKGLSRLFYRICGSGLKTAWKFHKIFPCRVLVFPMFFFQKLVCMHECSMENFPTNSARTPEVKFLMFLGHGMVALVGLGRYNVLSGFVSALLFSLLFVLEELWQETQRQRKLARKKCNTDRVTKEEIVIVLPCQLYRIIISVPWF